MEACIDQRSRTRVGVEAQLKAQTRNYEVRIAAYSYRRYEYIHVPSTVARPHQLELHVRGSS